MVESSNQTINYESSTQRNKDKSSIQSIKDQSSNQTIKVGSSIQSIQVVVDDVDLDLGDSHRRVKRGSFLSKIKSFGSKVKNLGSSFKSFGSRVKSLVKKSGNDLREKFDINKFGKKIGSLKSSVKNKVDNFKNKFQNVKDRAERKFQRLKQTAPGFSKIKNKYQKVVSKIKNSKLGHFVTRSRDKIRSKIQNLPQKFNKNFKSRCKRSTAAAKSACTVVFFDAHTLPALEFNDKRSAIEQGSTVQLIARPGIARNTIISHADVPNDPAEDVIAVNEDGEPLGRHFRVRPDDRNKRDSMLVHEGKFEYHHVNIATGEQGRTMTKELKYTLNARDEDSTPKINLIAPPPAPDGFKSKVLHKAPPTKTPKHENAKTKAPRYHEYRRVYQKDNVPFIQENNGIQTVHTGSIRYTRTMDASRQINHMEPSLIPSPTAGSSRSSG
jgi:hypothetical protein